MSTGIPRLRRNGFMRYKQKPKQKCDDNVSRENRIHFLRSIMGAAMRNFDFLTGRMQQRIDQNRLPTKPAQWRNVWNKGMHGGQRICHADFKADRTLEQFRRSILSKEAYP